MAEPILLKIEQTPSFKKQFKKLKQSGKTILIQRLKELIILLAENNRPLPEIYRDHPLKGKLSSYREAHAADDLLLICR